MNINPNLIEFSATAFRPKDDNTLDSLTASISFPADKENDVIAQTLDDEDLVAYVIGRRKVSVSWRPGHYDREGLYFRYRRLSQTNEESYLQKRARLLFLLHCRDIQLTRYATTIY